MQDLASLSVLPQPKPSACPGLLRIVPALDGGICRVKLPKGQLSPSQARAIAQAALQHASGVLEITNRSNLQIRGVVCGQEEALIRALLAAGLGPRHAHADDVRNVLISPAAGLDPQALWDTQIWADELLALLEDTPELHQLSAKFAFLLDGGEGLAMRQHPHDIWVAPYPQDSACLGLGFTGCPTDAPFVILKPAQLTSLVETLLRVFLRYASPEVQRLRDLFHLMPQEAYWEQVHNQLPFTLNRPQPKLHHPVVPEPFPMPLGIFPQQQREYQMALVRAPLGRIQATQLMQTADWAEQVQLGEPQLRLTPWQGLLLANIPHERAADTLHTLSQLGWLTDPKQPLSQIIACTGSQACRKGLADTKADAVRLAQRLPTVPFSIHLTGCERSCAAAHPVEYSLLAQAPDQYRLYQRSSDSSGFGQLLASSLSITQAAVRLSSTLPAGVPHA